MFVDQLYNTALLDPTNNGASQLLILSGYASPNLAYEHINELLEKIDSPIVRLYVGMVARDGISRGAHSNFKRLSVDDRPLNFSCYYLQSVNHSKIYIWLDANGAPIEAFTGSSNYTRNGFLNESQIEVLESCDPTEAFSLFNSLIVDAVNCNSTEIPDLFNIYEPEEFRRLRQTVSESAQEAQESTTDTTFTRYSGFEHIEVSILSNGNVPGRSGLNWGQRAGREPNQAYIRLTADIYRTDFFPPIGTRFTIQTDDDQSFICTRAQTNGKAIETPENNSHLGRYFRRRLGLPEGAYVRLEDLQNYGRTTIEFYKIDNETYFMDFRAG